MALSTGVFQLLRALELETFGTGRQRLLGQVASIQVTPDSSQLLLTTAEGEVWSLKLRTTEPAELRCGSM